MIYTAGPVLRNGADGLVDGKPWVSMQLSRNIFTISTRLTFLVFGFSTNVPLTILTRWLLRLALLAQGVVSPGTYTESSKTLHNEVWL